MRINFVVNPARADAVSTARETAAFLRGHKVSVGAEYGAAEQVGALEVASEQICRADLVITFGGDGTLIRGAHLCSEIGTPILGVHFGRFGFVTQCRPEDIGAALSQFFDGIAKIDERMMMQSDLVRAGATLATLHCLNEAAIQRSATSHMMSFRVAVDGKLLTRYPADGVIIATPTGSTAYSLSAGGPIVDPRVQALVLTALNPHTLSARPLVLSSGASIEISVAHHGDAVLSSDGQSRLHLLGDDCIRVTRSPRVTRLVMIDDSDFLTKLRDRLLWSQSVPREHVDDE